MRTLNRVGLVSAAIVLLSAICHLVLRGRLIPVVRLTFHLDAQNNLICGECYVANPPIVDVQIIFAQVIARMNHEA